MFQINYVCTLCSTLFKIAVLIPCLGTRGAHFSYNFLLGFINFLCAMVLFLIICFNYQSIICLCTIYALIHQYTFPEKSIKQKHVDFMTYVITVISIFICSTPLLKAFTRICSIKTLLLNFFSKFTGKRLHLFLITVQSCNLHFCEKLNTSTDVLCEFCVNESYYGSDN